MPDAPLAILADVWTHLRAGQADAHHAYRYATLATADAMGRPDVRTVVLRHVDEAARCIEFQTDRRSPKYDTLRHNPTAAWLFYDGASARQLRILTDVILHTGDAVADAAWGKVPDAMRRGYRVPLAPGALLDGPIGPKPNADEDGRRNFVVARCPVRSVEWLKRDDGVWHRIAFTWPNGETAWQWLHP